MQNETEVFGPMRPIAARRAIEALRTAREVYEAFGGFASEAATTRLHEARTLRATYAEYGDSFTGH